MKVLIGLSGGVDSSYAALKLINMGYTVEGAILKMHSYTEVAEAEACAASLGIPLHIIDCSEQFEREVVQNFISEYKNARTPNPCIICNSEIKFAYLLEYADKNGFDLIATGHYAKMHALYPDGNRREITPENRLGGEICESECRFAVGFADDAKKDQTYMLWRLPQKVLGRLIFAIGEDRKDKVRQEASNAGLVSAERADSQEICFVPDGDYARFIENRTEPSREGDFVDENGKILGRHKGIIRYTVGQRKGLGISASGRIFVRKIDPISNNIILSLNDATYCRVRISGIRFQGIAPKSAGASLKLKVKLRYAAKPVDARVEFLEGDRAEIFLEQPVRAVTPGQSAVFYDGDILAFGGFIDEAY